MTVLVIGAAGELGSMVASGLRHRGVASVPSCAGPSLDDVVIGDLADLESLDRARRAYRALPRVVADARPGAARDERDRRGARRLQRIVKVSNIPIADWRRDSTATTGRSSAGSPCHRSRRRCSSRRSSRASSTSSAS
jgi:nucleoside-diphosphate-sugar epimerase